MGGGLGEENLEALLQESLSVAHKTGALETKDLERVVADTTVQPKAIAHPTDARLMYRAIEKLVALAKREEVPLRQSYLRVGKRAAIMVGRYIHAHQFKRARRMLRFLRTRLGRLIRDIGRKIDGDQVLEALFILLLSLASQVRHQDRHQRGPKIYALHAPEVECISVKGKARTLYEFGCKVSVATPVTSPKGGQFVLHAKALHGNPYDGHTLGPIIADLERLTGVETRRIHVDKSLPPRRRGAIAATTIPTGSGSGSPGRSAGSLHPSGARCAAEPPSSRSSAISRPSTAWAAIISRATRAIALMPYSPLPATTSACSCAGWPSFCVPLSSNSFEPTQPLRPSGNPSARILHSRRFTGLRHDDTRRSPAISNFGFPSVGSNSSVERPREGPAARGTGRVTPPYPLARKRRKTPNRKAPSTSSQSSFVTRYRRQTAAHARFSALARADAKNLAVSSLPMSEGPRAAS